METDNVVYLLSSSMDDEIRKSVFASMHINFCVYSNFNVCV